ncbi:MAG: hypothetical protein M3Q48_14490 [Actinomycetota bacterium]|nr:hypothetical protein [Actinomycetota bacterium]
MSRRPRRRTRGEGGFVAVEWVVAVGFLLFPTVLLVLSFPAWVERQGMARVAAQEAARAVALANDTESGAEAGRALGDEIARNHGVDPTNISVSYDGMTRRGGSVTATVSVDLPALTFPGLGSLGSVRWSTRHTELVDRYRPFTP